MTVKIKSLLASGPIVVPLNTGSSVRLSPGQISPELSDIEVADNAKVAKLRRQGMIEIESTEGPAESHRDATDDAPPVQPEAKSGVTHAAGAGTGETESTPRSRA